MLGTSGERLLGKQRRKRGLWAAGRALGKEEQTDWPDLLDEGAEEEEVQREVIDPLTSDFLYARIY